MRRRAAMGILWAVFLPLLAVAGWGGPGFSHRPVFVDPDLGGWAAPLETLSFQVGAGELYYVAGIFLGEKKTLTVVCRSKLTLRQIERKRIEAFAARLVRALGPSVGAMAAGGTVERVVLLFYPKALSGNVLQLELWEAELPARSVVQPGAVALRLAERRAAQADVP